MTSLVRMTLVRHGYSEANKAHVLSGTHDVPLAQEGVNGIRALRELGVYKPAQRYYSSPLLRCRQTFCEAYGASAKLDGTIPELCEVCFGDLEGKALNDEDSQLLWNSWLQGHGFADEHGVESFAQASSRGERAICDLALRCAGMGVTDVVVVTHSAIMRAAIMRMARLDVSGWLRLNVPNGLGYRLGLAVTGDGVTFLRADPTDPEAPAEASIFPKG